MRIKSTWNAAIIRSIIFIVLPLIVSVLMYIKMTMVLHEYMESQVADKSDFLGQLASQRLSAQLEDLEHIAEYFRDGRIEENNMSAVIDNLLKNHSRISCGILKLDGTPVSGKALPYDKYPTVVDAFRGKSMVRYQKGEGLLFIVPIYNGINIKYALYEFLDENVLFESFNENCYNGQGQMILADSSQQQMFSMAEGGDISDLFKQNMQNIYRELHNKMGLDTSVAIYYEANGREDFVFVSDMAQNNMYLLGTVPHDVVAANISSLPLMVLLVFGLLLVLLIIGTFSVVNANAKVRESEELRKAKYMAEEASKSKSTFLANMSHELRTPINVILGMNEMILREEIGKDIRERAMDIKSAAQILLSLINDVLDFSKIESGKMNILSVEYDFVVMIRDLTLLCESRARQKSLNFELEVQPDLPIGLYGDDIHIRQVLTNLLTNAVKYTPEGTVTLKVSGERTDHNMIILHFEVIDTGIGIKQEDIDKLMIPYTRIEEERNRYVEGTGLGLAIIINLLKLMGSQLQLESVYGEGSKFYFDLEQKIIDTQSVGDIQKRMDDMVKDYDYRVSFIAPQARILMVDDNSMNRKIFVSLLKDTQVLVKTVSSGKKCLEIVQKEHFDLIFMDYLMPEMDGIETLHKLHKLKGNLCENTPIIALTANAFNGDRERYMEIGFDDFLSKPIVTEKLETLIREMLPEEYVKESLERITPPVKTEKENNERNDTENDLEEFPVVEGVNWEFAKLHVKDRELLIHSLQDFYNNIDMEYKEISNLLEKIDTEEGLKNYRIRVHALKSTSAMIGILSVSELSKLLEYAARDNEIEMVPMLHPILMKELLKTKERLQPLAGEKEDSMTFMDNSQLFELLNMLHFSIEQMDIGGADSIMGQMNKYSYDVEFQERINELSQKVAALDFDGALEDIDKILETEEK